MSSHTLQIFINLLNRPETILFQKKTLPNPKIHVAKLKIIILNKLQMPEKKGTLNEQMISEWPVNASNGA